MLRTYITSISVILFSVCLTSAADARASGESHPLEALTEVANKFVQDFLSNEDEDVEFQIEIVEPDNRLRLRLCDGAVTAFWPYSPTNLKRMPVGVRCQGTVKWKVFLQTSVKQYREISVINRPVNSGQVLDASMISKREIDILSVRREVVEKYEHMIGHIFNQSVLPNTPLSNHLLDLPLLVRRGDLVRMTSSGGTISVDAEVEVLADGYAQQRIRVRNTRSGKLLNAIVVGNSLVTANP